MNLKIETNRLVLRKVSPEDYEDLQEGLNNINIAKNITSMPHPYTKERVEDYFGKNIKKWEKDLIDDYLFVIELKSEKKVIGAMGLHEIDFEKGESETGSWINEEYWRKGYITEAKIAVNDFAFRVLGLKKLISPVFAENEASNTTQKKMGYECVSKGKEKGKCLATGKIHDKNMYELTKEKWLMVREGIMQSQKS